MDGQQTAGSCRVVRAGYSDHLDMSAICSSIAFTEMLPGQEKPIEIVNMLTLEKLAEFLSTMTESFVGFHPLGVVLVAMLGVGVADHSGFISALLKTMLTFTPKLF
jgi:aminobenzoyl-glutamate transport protein